MSGKSRKRSRRQPVRREVKIDELQAVLARTEGALSADDFATLKAAIETLAFLTQELERKGTSLDRLRRLIFGPSTETTSRVLGDSDATETTAATPQSNPPATGSAETTSSPKPGHGRNGASAYHGADKVKVAHATLKHGAACPECKKGKVYRLAEPAVIVRVRGMAPLSATVWELERLRCNLCGVVFTADAPPGIGAAKYDETVSSMIGLLKYGSGLPFNRLERLQRAMGIPLPAATQWELVQRGSRPMRPVFDEMVRLGGQGELVHQDDTNARILELMKERRRRQAAGEDQDEDERTGMFTTGLVSVCGGHRISLFVTGPQHAGENLADLLKHRSPDLEPPIQMCDALSHNVSGDFETIVANCLAHARRGFVEVAPRFPGECRFVLESLREVYRNDTEARQRKLSAEERLRLHQKKSGPVMGRLKKWCLAQFREHLVEPNSGLGDAITYLTKHWKKLVVFLRMAGAPLDNNVCERALKRAILHRKNSLFFKTMNGARVGDIYMSLIHTAELHDVNPFEYLVALQRHQDAVAESPSDWMPWNYKEALARATSAASVAT